MTIETKKKNWFRRHLVLSIIFGILILGAVGSVFEGDSKSNTDLTGKVISEQKNDSAQTTKCTGTTFEQLCINKKIDDCTRLCAGTDIEIPAVKTDCHSTCYQVYYYGGEKDLDDLIIEYKGQK
jgi:hypothetical protein